MKAHPHAWIIGALMAGMGMLARSRAGREIPKPALPSVEMHPPEAMPEGLTFRGQNAGSWQRQPLPSLNLPDFVLMDSLWETIRARNDTIWTLTTTTLADTVILPPLPWKGEGCQQAVDLPLLLYPSSEIQSPTSPLEIHIQVRTDQDPSWRETRRWGSPFWMFLREADTSYVPGCMQEGPFADSMFLWGGGTCWGVMDPVPGESLQIRLILRGGDAGVTWTVGLWGAGWRWRSPGEEVWDLRWSGLPHDLGLEVSGVPCSGKIWMWGRVMRRGTTVVDTFVGLFYLPAPFNERYVSKKPKVFARNLPSLGETLRLVARVNDVQKETTLIFPHYALVPAETLLRMINPPVWPLGLTEEGVLMQRFALDRVLLERWRWTGEVDTLVNHPGLTYRFLEAAYDEDDPFLVVGVPFRAGDSIFVVFHPRGYVVDTLHLGGVVALVDLPGKHRWRATVAKGGYRRTELWAVDLRWDGQRLISDTLHKLVEWTTEDVFGRSVEAFAAPDTGWERWAVSLDSCAVEFYEGGNLVAQTRHCPEFQNMRWDPDEKNTHRGLDGKRSSGEEGDSMGRAIRLAGLLILLSGSGCVNLPTLTMLILYVRSLPRGPTPEVIANLPGEFPVDRIPDPGDDCDYHGVIENSTSGFWTVGGPDRAGWARTWFRVRGAYVLPPHGFTRNCDVAMEMDESGTIQVPRECH